MVLNVYRVCGNAWVKEGDVAVDRAGVVQLSFLQKAFAMKVW